MLETGDYQTGFKEGFSTHVHATSLIKSIMKHQRKDTANRKIYVFVDLRKAYDSVRRDQLFEMLMEDYKNSPERMKIVETLLKLHKNGELIFDQEKVIPVTQGVPQGSPLSPRLFNYYLDKAIKSSKVLQKAAEKGELLAFADDILLPVNSLKIAEKLLKEMENWKESFGLELNKQKTVFFTNRKDYKDIEKIGDGEGYKRVESFKYLGIKCSLKYEKIRKETKKVITRNLQIMSRRLKKCKEMKVKETIIQAYFRSLVIFHCTPLYIAGMINEDFILALER